MFEKFYELLNKHTEMKILYKDESLLMKIIAKILFFNKDFMKLYVTTLGNRIYYPTRKYVEDKPETAVHVLAHEFVHINDDKEMGFIKYEFLYLFPQVLAVFAGLSVFAFFNLGFLWCLSFLVFLTPIPAKWRKDFELKGYKMSIFIYQTYLERLRYDSLKQEKILQRYARMVATTFFKGPAYYYMWPIKNQVRDELMTFASNAVYYNLGHSIQIENDMYRIIKRTYDESHESK